MKEAAGEANLTVIAIILIGVIAVVVTPLITSTMKTTAKKTCCQNAGGVMKGNACVDGDGEAISNYWNEETKECAD